jgi:release factor glutamine methyltransferase
VVEWNESYDDLPIGQARKFGELLQRATELLQDEGHPQPRNLAIQVFRAFRGPEDFHRPLPELDRDIPQLEASNYISVIDEVATGAPLAAIVGWAGFRHLTLDVNEHTLIPRPETEGLVDLALARVSTGVVADIGTGTGAIALSLAREGAFRLVIGTDISRKALVVARRNGRRAGLKVSWRPGDLLEPLGTNKLDLLVSNPPYLTALEYDELDWRVREYEPATALIGGHDGLEPYRRLLAGAQQHLNPGGWIALEVDSRRARETAEIATAHNWSEVRIYDDLFGRARYLLARREETP